MARNYQVEFKSALLSGAADRFVFPADSFARPVFGPAADHVRDHARDFAPATDELARATDIDALAAAGHQHTRHPVDHHRKLELPVAEFGQRDDHAATWKFAEWHHVPLI